MSTNSLCLQCSVNPREVGLYCQGCYAEARLKSRAASYAQEEIPWRERVVYGGTRQTPEEIVLESSWKRRGEV